MTDQQRRAHPRYAIELDAEVIGDGEPLLGRTHDLSRGGFCMLARGPAAVGSECRVKLALVFSENQFSEHLELPATVVWCTATRGGHQLGIKFGALDADSRKYLDLFMQFLDAPDAEDDDESEGP